MHVQLGLLVVALVALLAFTTRGLSLPSLESARVRRQGASPLLSRRLLEFAYYVLLPVARFAVATKVSPNVSSWMCLTVGLSAGVAGAQAVAGPGAISTCAAWSSGGSFRFRVIPGIPGRSRIPG